MNGPKDVGVQRNLNCSVVIRTLNEADRLRLTLTSLACQSRIAEVVVVNDGSQDHTADVIAGFQGRFPLKQIHHQSPHGRSAASNAGAAVASGDIIILLDGDTVAHSDLVKTHIEAHERQPGLLGRGETYNLRCTRFLLDPEACTPRPGEEARIAAMPAGEKEKARVTRQQIEADFASIERRAAPGIYPGAGPRLLYELEIDALRHHPESTVLWAASSGSNFSVDRAAYLQSGGCDEAIHNSEHRELALRLCSAGMRMGFVEGARSYHMTHRVGWRDPLETLDWEEIFYRRYPLPAVKLLSVFWSTIGERGHVPPEARITSLPELERRALDTDGPEHDAMRQAIGLPALVAI